MVDEQAVSECRTSSEYEKSSDIRTCPMFWTSCPTYFTKTSDIMSEENIRIIN